LLTAVVFETSAAGTSPAVVAGSPAAVLGGLYSVSRVTISGHLTRHLGILVRRCEVIVILLVLIVLRGVVLGGLGKVNNLAAGTTSAFDDVVEVNLLHAIFLACSR
jgi:cell division protein FtsX